VKIVSWDPEKKIAFLEKDGQRYKAKVLSHNKNELVLYLFNSNETITVSIRENTETSKKAPNQRTTITSPIAGRIIKIYVHAGQRVAKDATLLTIESMKMENEIRAPFNLFVKTVSIDELDLVKQNQLLLKIEEG